MNIEHADGDADGEGDQDHGEEEVLAEQRNGQRRRWDDLGQQQEEHSQREQNRDAECHLLSRIRRQIEDQDREERNSDAGDDQVDGVEQRLAPERHDERDV